jgi:hypothetical protein
MPTKWLQERAKGSKNGHGMPQHRAFCGKGLQGRAHPRPGPHTRQSRALPSHISFSQQHKRQKTNLLTNTQTNKQTNNNHKRKQHGRDGIKQAPHPNHQTPKSKPRISHHRPPTPTSPNPRAQAVCGVESCGKRALWAPPASPGGL